MTLYLLDFNNYYNRVKRTGLYYHNLDTFKVGEIENINFNPNDGISTEVVANWVIGKTEPDYAVLADDDTHTIISRWFVMEAVRTRAGQYKFILRRDLLVDFEADYMNRPCFIEKAMLRDGDPFIFNSEDMTFNQIKQKEILLKDPTHCAWIVGYINKNRENKNITAEVTGVGEYATYSSMAAYPYITELNQMHFKSALNNIKYQVIVEDAAAERDGIAYKITFDETGWYEWEQLSITLPASQRDIIQLSYNQYEEEVGTVIGKAVRQWCSRIRLINLAEDIARENNNHTVAETSTFLNRVPQTIKLIDTGDYVSIKRGPATPTSARIVPTNASQLAVELADVLGYANNITASWNLSGNIANFVELLLEYEFYGLTQTEFLPFKYGMTLYGSNAVNGLTDAPYDMFAIPYPTDEYEITCSVIESGETKTGVIEGEAGMMIANEIATQLTEAGCYDIQLLPYCPIPSLGRTPAHIDLTNMELNKDYCLITATFNNSTTIRSVCLYPTKSTFTLNLYNYWDRAENVIKDYSIPITEKKIQALTEMNRICSPNYNGQFEFNAAKNNGVDYFNVDCTYKPFQPYIHIAPNFKGLYGGDYDDSRGLICGGDFSLPRITDKWQQYELNNKNYMNSFNRTIENMEVQQNYQKTQELVNAITGTFSGAASGAAMGAMTGGGAVGLGVGAAVGGLAAGVAGIADIQMGEKLRSEALDYTKDQFGYSLGNIKALPYALSRVSSFNANNKIYPVLEFYSATEEEKQALRNKIKYNGMTVMRIDKLSNYVYYEFPLVYLKGRMINLSDPDNLDEHAIDTHLAIELSNEIYKGFYLILQTGGLEL